MPSIEKRLDEIQSTQRAILRLLKKEVPVKKVYLSPAEILSRFKIAKETLRKKRTGYKTKEGEVKPVLFDWKKVGGRYVYSEKEIVEKLVIKSN